MDGNLLLKKIKRWADEVGQERAESVLFNEAKLGLSTIQKLIAGKYVSSPKRISKALIAILEREAKRAS